MDILKRFPWIAWVLAGVCLAGALAAFCLPISNPDLYWHLSAARWMAEHKAFPRADWLSQTMYGRPWTDFEWLSQLVWGAVHGAGGVTALWALKALLFSLGGALVWAILGLYGLSPAGRGLGVFAWALGLTSANDLRPENFSLLFFLGLWLWLEARRLGRLGGVRPWVQAAAAAGGFVLWANLHAGFVYGLALLGIYSFVDAAVRRSRELSLVWLAACAAPLLNPYGAQIYVVPWEHLAWMDELKTFIQEWRPPSLLNRWHWPLWGVLFASFLAVLLRIWRRRDVPYEHLAAVAAFGLSAGSHVRTGCYFVCVGVPVCAAILERERAEGGARPVKAFCAAAFAALWAFFGFCIVDSLSYRQAFDSRYTPARLAGFIAGERGLQGRRMYHPWHWGGYLGYRLSPGLRVFADGRYIFQSRLKEAFEVSREPGRFSAFLDREGIELVVLEADAGRVRETVELEGGGQEVLERPLYLYFLPRESWALVCWDSQGGVFARRSALDMGWIASREYRHFRPDDLRPTFLKVSQGSVPYAEVEAEVGRWIAWNGEGEQARATREWLGALRAEAPPTGSARAGRPPASRAR